VFQTGGHVGYAIGPLLAAAVVVPRGPASLAFFSGVTLIAMALMSWLGARHSELSIEQPANFELVPGAPLSDRRL
jgi:FSR family fosmidomycin resistance protein-like MFS transporter